MESAELPCEKKACLGFKWTILRPTPAVARKTARSKVMLLTSKEKIEGVAKCSLLAYSGGLCTVSDTIRTLSGMVSLTDANYDKVFSESEDTLRTSGFKNTLLKAL